MKRMDFKMVKDGSRTIIVLDGADSETDAALYRILCAACGIEAPIGAAEQAATAESLPTTRVEGLSPAPEADKIPSADAINQMDSYADILRRGTTISSGAYKGMTAQQVLNKDKEAGMATLSSHIKHEHIQNQIGGNNMQTTSCWNCKHASIHTYFRRGVGASAHVGTFKQTGAFCTHPDCAPPGPLIFYGKTRPHYCPLKPQRAKKQHWAYARTMAVNPNLIR